MRAMTAEGTHSIACDQKLIFTIFDVYAAGKDVRVKVQRILNNGFINHLAQHAHVRNLLRNS